MASLAADTAACGAAAAEVGLGMLIPWDQKISNNC